MLSTPRGLVQFFSSLIPPHLLSLSCIYYSLSTTPQHSCLSVLPAFFTGWIVSTRRVGTTSVVRYTVFCRIDINI